MTTTNMPLEENHKITLIAAMGTDRTIGLNNTMPWHLPEDLKHFKSRTLGKTMIIGRHTFESIGKPLPGRKTIIVSRTQTAQDYDHPDCQVASSLEQALLFAQETSEHNGEIMVVGGGQIYQQAIHLATHLSLTQIHKAFSGDTFFPQLQADEWIVESSHKHKQADAPYLEYSFQELKRRRN